MTADDDLLNALLDKDEGINHDFKSRIDVDSSQGKAKFIKLVLALANSPIKPSTIVLGVEDGTRRVVGVQNDMNDERLQNVVHTYCRPPIVFIYKVLRHSEGNVGVIFITSHRRPYRHNEKYLELLPLSERNSLGNSVFIRHGSTTAVADPEEIMQMEKEKRSSDSEGLGEIALEISDLRSSISNIRWTLDRLDSNLDRERAIEYMFVGILSGIVSGYLETTDQLLPLLLAPILPILIGITSSAVKFINFGLLRSIFVGVIIGLLYAGISTLEPYLFQYLSWISKTIPIFILFGAIKGAIAGLVTIFFLSRFDN